MDLDDTPQQAAYREQVRDWLEQHKPEAPVLQGPDALREESEIIAARRAWQGKLAEGGLAGVTWPKEFGGQGLGPIEQVICNQEIGRARVPGILDAIGVGMLGPSIIAHGSDEQKTRYLGPSMPTPIASRIPGTLALPISWLQMTCSIGPIPWPPYSLGQVTPASPPSASLPCHTLRAAMISSSSSSASGPRSTGASSRCSSSQARTLAR